MLANFIREFPRTRLRSVVIVAGNMAVGAFIGQMLICWISLAGVSPSTLLTFLTALTIALFSRQRIQQIAASPSAQPPGSQSRQLLSLLTTLAVTGVMVLLSWLAPELLSTSLTAGSRLFGMSLVGSVPADTFATSMYSAAAVMLIPGAVLVLLLISIQFWNACCCAQHPSSESARSMLAFGPGMSLLLWHAVSTQPLAITVTAVLITSALLKLSVHRRPALTSMQRPDRSISPGKAIPTPSFSRPVAILLAASCGLLAVAIARFTMLLMPGSLPLVILTFLQTAVLIRLLTSQRLTTLLNERLAAVAAAVLLACLPLMSDRIMDLDLALTSAVSWPWLLLVVRALQPAVLLTAATLPLWLWHRSRSAAPEAAMSATVGWMGCGAIVAVVAVSQSVPFAWLLLIGILTLLTASLFEQTIVRESRLTFPWFRVQRPAVSATLLLLSIACSLALLTTSVDSGRAARLLFSARSLAAWRMGIDRELIPHSDSSRLVRTQTTAQGEIQIWRRSGHVVEFLRDGMSLGRISLNTRLTPQPMEEILPAILPLAVHPAPGRILVLGDETGICARICSQFPVQRIVAVRGNRQLTELLAEYTWNQQLPGAGVMDRISLLHQSPTVAVRTKPAVPFDVVISTASANGLTTGCAEFTSEFYWHVRKQMADNGVFCQRFQLHDLGPEPLRQVLATAMQHFRHVVAVQSVPGEIVILAGNSDQRFLQKHLLHRLQQDFVRREIAGTGWDWVQIAVLPMLDATDPVGIFSQQQPPRALTVASGHLPLAMPVELHRQANRAEELYAALAPYQLRLAEALPPDEAHQEIRRRLNLLTQQLEILAGMPDEPWTYRRSLRSEMQRNPRPPKEVIRDSRIVRDTHPTDRRQQDYFLSLGQSIQTVRAGRMSAETFAQLTEFAELNEPLLSFFAHYELIRLYEMANHPDPAAEYRHRLHTVFFTEASDASVRPVVAAMQQLIEFPELLDNDAERFDHLNSMMQKLIERWEARTSWEPKSASRVQNDVDQSVLVTNLALEKLQQWSAAAQVSPDEFLKRRRFIHSALIQPLRDYGQQVLKHRLQQAWEEPDAEPDTESPNDLPLLISPEELMTN